MGQKLCGGDKISILLDQYKPDLINHLVGTQGASKTTDIFTKIKEEVTSKFNGMPLSATR
jgi:hypothetical protein